MKTYLIVVKLGDEKRYAKLINDNGDNFVLQFTNDKINASLFSGEQIEEYVPMIKYQQHVFLNNTTAYFNHNLHIYAEPYGEVSLQ